MLDNQIHPEKCLTTTKSYNKRIHINLRKSHLCFMSRITHFQTTEPPERALFFTNLMIQLTNQLSTVTGTIYIDTISGNE